MSAGDEDSGGPKAGDGAAGEVTRTGDRPRKQVDGGQAGMFEELKLIMNDGQSALVLCHLLSTGPLGAGDPRTPLLDGRTMLAETEYWLIQTEAWSRLVWCYARLSDYPGLRIQFEYKGQRDSFETSQTDPTEVLTALEYTMWDPASGRTWPEGALAFGTQNRAQAVRGIALEATATGARNAVWWAQTGEANIRPSALDGQVLHAIQPATDAAWYAGSLLTTPA